MYFFILILLRPVIELILRDKIVWLHAPTCIKKTYVVSPSVSLEFSPVTTHQFSILLHDGRSL